MAAKIITGSFILILFIAIIIYLREKSRLSKLLNLKLDINPEKACIGGPIDFFIRAHPEKTIKSSMIEGELVCKKFSHSWLVWLENVGLFGFPVGEPITMITFSLGKDLMFVNGTSLTYGGRLRMPEDSFATESSRVIKIGWYIIIRIHAVGFSPAIIKRKLTVIKSNGKDLTKIKENMLKEKNIDIFNIYKPKRTVENQNLILMVEGDPRKELKKDHSGSSRFSYLELEDERQEN